MAVTSESAGPNALAHTAIYDAVIRLVRDNVRGKLLDIPAGEGALAQSLADLGFSVVCCDLYPEMFKLRGSESVKAIWMRNCLLKTVNSTLSYALKDLSI